MQIKGTFYGAIKILNLLTTISVNKKYDKGVRICMSIRSAWQGTTSLSQITLPELSELHPKDGGRR